MDNKTIRVLLIEDNPGDTRLIREMLAEVRGARFDLECADRLSTGMERLAADGIDVVLLDLALPDSMGFDTFTTVYAQAPQVPILLLTGLEDEALGVRAMREGAQDYLVKGRADGDSLARAIRYAIERKGAEEALRRSEASLAQAQQLSHLGSWEWNRVTGEIFWSDELYRMFGITPGAADLGETDLRKAITERIHPDDRERYRKAANTSLQEKTPYEIEYRIVFPDGMERTIHARGEQTLDKDGNIVRFAGTALDITERVQAEEELALKGRIVHEANDAIITTSNDSDFTITSWNPGAEEIYGWKAEEVIGRSAAMLRNEYLTGSREEVLKGILETGRFDGEVIQTRKDGSRVNIDARVIALWNAKGGIIGWVSVNRDITERKQAEEEIRQRTAQLEALRKVGLELTSQLDLDELLRSIVSRAIELLGGSSGGLYLYRPERDVLEWAVVIGTGLVPIGTVLHRGEGLSGKVWETGQPLFVDNYQHWEGQAAIYEGQPFSATVGVPIRWGPAGAGGEFLGVLDVLADPPRTFSAADAELLNLFATQAAIAIENARLFEQAQQEIAERKQAEKTIRHLAYHDPLTGLPNRRLFNERLDLEMAHAHRDQRTLAVMLLDLDNFKDVNDTLGHSVGDQLLHAVGERLTSLLRQSDTVARMGGDEFMLILPEANGKVSADTIAIKILEAFRKPFEFDGHKIRTTTSIGIAMYPDDGEDSDALMGNADVAMYRAKDLGRDEYQRYSGTTTNSE